MTMRTIERARAFSEAKLDALRCRMPGLLPPGAAVVACGSYARREASAASDFDYFTILPAAEGAPTPPRWEADLKAAIAEIVGVEPAKDGAFAKSERADEMVRNIGGQHDDNAKLTRRILFLLEGAALSSEAEAQAVRHALLGRYIGAGLDDGLALFLLSDVIRYYRTVAVDYEFKTTEGDRPKPWGLRNAKLMFSRKMLYASGVFSVAAARAADPAIVTTRLDALFDLPPLARLETICGNAASRPVLGRYDAFLAHLSDPALRQSLEALRQDDDHADFTALKHEGRLFAADLARLFEKTFPTTHPIHRAMVF